ncbi:MAG: DUF3592 domain-containing protein [Betaproteobacteria bacterium]|nr:DUF3592 domain-containing protein [Betaproteobacteria bacterium]
MTDPVMTWGFVAAGAFAQGVALMLARRSAARLSAGGRAMGKVARNEEQLVERSKGAPRTFYFPVVEFDTPQGQSVVFRSDTGRGAPTPVGTPLPVVYDPAQPSRAELATFRSLWLFPLLVSLLGLPFLVAGLVSLR